MRFHKIEMVGFKSFVDKTHVTFQEGITAVVGPNGCGKSNISDAIRWVLGEKSAKNLRGDKMEDVIFNGSELRKPIGMAEVNLSLQNVGGGGLTGFTEFEDVTITRRLYRNGDSEYLINNIPCRLKDIRDLLMDTGVGSRAYSIIEQGKIGQIVAAKPEERRYIIEEVAGISKYKTRKNEALSKLQDTSQNLDRVNDIIHEVKRQINSLDRQAKKAERYKKLSDELKRLELKLAWEDYNELLERTRQADERYEQATHDESAARNAVSAREADLSEARLKLAERERELSEFQRELHQLESEASHMEARAELAVTQLRDLGEREERMVLEREHLTREEQELEARTSSLMQEHHALKTELDAIQEELRLIESSFQDKSDRVRGIEGRIDTGRGVLFDIQADISQKSNRLTRLEERKAEIAQRTERAKAEEASTREMLLAVTLAKEKKELELGALRVAVVELEREQYALTEAIQKNKSMLREVDAALSRLREEFSQKNSRLVSLRELEESMEGCGEAVKAVVESGRRGELAGMHGILADLLQTEKRYERAIEAALGEKLQGLVVEGHTDAAAAIAFLKGSGKGRGTFVPVSPRAATIQGNPTSGADSVWKAAELVSARDGYSAIVEGLLGGTLVASDIETAISVWSERTGHTVVTLDGDVLEPEGFLSGGSQASGGGLLSKKREIRELTVDVERLGREVAEADARLAELSSEHDGFEKNMALISDALSEKRLSVVAAEKDFAAEAAELERVRKKQEVLEFEAAQREQEDAELADGIALLRKDIEDAHMARQERESSIADLQDSLKALKSELETVREALTAKKVELSALLQRHESSSRDIKLADIRKDELAAKAGRLRDEASDISTRRDELTVSKTEAEAKVDTIMKQVIGKKDALPGIQDAYQGVYDVIPGIEEAVKISRRDAEAAMRVVGDLELRRSELRMKSDHIADTVQHNYHVHINDIEEDIRGMEIDRDEADMNATELRIKLERLGPVNVGAIEEYNELMERFEFLNSQKEDLESSVKRLKEAIGKINKTSEELFMEAFDSINERFKEVFVSLFGGGRAELRLTVPESGDLLESGLDIVAQPPGKKLQNLTLFSGGEKALIAVALVFSCFLVKPSPFCVLDEVDAPLDESNVQRFGNMVKEFSDKTQFIIITHSRPTMELADALYGVTMDEPGASRLVSVKIREAMELAEV
jgi:chromosome segregation protein